VEGGGRTEEKVDAEEQKRGARNNHGKAGSDGVRKELQIACRGEGSRGGWRSGQQQEYRTVKDL